MIFPSQELPHLSVVRWDGRLSSCATPQLAEPQRVEMMSFPPWYISRSSVYLGLVTEGARSTNQDVSHRESWRRGCEQIISKAGQPWEIA